MLLYINEPAFGSEDQRLFKIMVARYLLYGALVVFLIKGIENQAIFQLYPATLTDSPNIYTSFWRYYFAQLTSDTQQRTAQSGIQFSHFNSN